MDESKGVEDLRGELGKRIDAAFFAGEVTIVTKNGEPRAVLVPYDWYRETESRRRQILGQSGAAAGADLDPSTSDAIRTGGPESGG